MRKKKDAKIRVAILAMNRRIPGLRVLVWNSGSHLRPGTAVQPLGNLLFKQNIRDPGLGSLQRLSNEIVSDILALLDAKDLARSGVSSEAFYVFSHQEALCGGIWKRISLTSQLDRLVLGKKISLTSQPDRLVRRYEELRPGSLEQLWNEINARESQTLSGLFGKHFWSSSIQPLVDQLADGSSLYDAHCKCGQLGNPKARYFGREFFVQQDVGGFDVPVIYQWRSCKVKMLVQCSSWHELVDHERLPKLPVPSLKSLLKHLVALPISPQPPVKDRVQRRNIISLQVFRGVGAEKKREFYQNAKKVQKYNKRLKELDPQVLNLKSQKVENEDGASGSHSQSGGRQESNFSSIERLRNEYEMKQKPRRKSEQRKLRQGSRLERNPNQRQDVKEN
ncbi:hypothetical protein SELMODRAFT_404640 [Selaginella moellendorffii]|uniref:F-box domain-containing protein n=1 Tax=Selaginella moellendorffii TaxID=88036 RepID=D8QVY6_SELML|nr:hypothetical protein SELMODRAFT_404640 [Selaginella moellendorffii]